MGRGQQVEEYTIPEYAYSDAFTRYLEAEDRVINILFGGAGSGKSIHAAIKVWLRMIVFDQNQLIIKKYYNSIEDTFYAALQLTARALGIFEMMEFKKSPLFIRCKENDKVILFRGMDNPDKVKSLETPSGPIEHTTMEECDMLTTKDVAQLAFRMRGGGKRLSAEEVEHIRLMVEQDRTATPDEVRDAINIAFGTYEGGEEGGVKGQTYILNPVDKKHWIYERFFESLPNIGTIYDDKFYIDDKIFVMHSDHWDNQFLTIEDHIRYESSKDIDEYMYNVYTRGYWGVIGHRVFKRVKVADLAPIRDKVGMCDHGLDWGFTSGATAWSRAYVDEKNKRIYILNEYGARHSHVDDNADYLANFLRGDEMVYCDSSDPDRVDLLNTALQDRLQSPIGKMATSVYKGSREGIGSKTLTIEYINQYTVIIDKKCTNMIKALSSCVWEEDDKTGHVKYGRIADNEYDHWADAFIYSQVHRAIKKGRVVSYG